MTGTEDPEDVGGVVGVDDVALLAPALLGAVLRTRVDGATVAVRLTEVEAYAGADDPASHAVRGPSARNASMFSAAGHLYVYRHLGLHHCVNVVTGSASSASAVLLRAGEVIEGASVARARRRAAGVCRQDRDLARGPARLAVALALDLRDDGTALGEVAELSCPVPIVLPTGPPPDVMAPDTVPPGGAPPGRASPAGLRPATEPPGVVRPTAASPAVVRRGARVGVRGPGADPDRFPWRFWLDGEPTVSSAR